MVFGCRALHRGEHLSLEHFIRRVRGKHVLYLYREIVIEEMSLVVYDIRRSYILSLENEKVKLIFKVLRR
jgi:hypothetical protein